MSQNDIKQIIDWLKSPVGIAVSASFAVAAIASLAGIGFFIYKVNHKKESKKLQDNHPPQSLDPSQDLVRDQHEESMHQVQHNTTTPEHSVATANPGASVNANSNTFDYRVASIFTSKISDSSSLDNQSQAVNNIPPPPPVPGSNTRASIPPPPPVPTSEDLAKLQKAPYRQTSPTAAASSAAPKKPPLLQQPAYLMEAVRCVK